MARRLDPKGKRTLGVLTKVSLTLNNSKVIRLILWIKVQMLKECLKVKLLDSS